MLYPHDLLKPQSNLCWDNRLINVKQTEAQSRGVIQRWMMLETNQTSTMKVTPCYRLIFLIYTDPILCLSSNNPKHVCQTHLLLHSALPGLLKSQVSIITPPPPFIWTASTILHPPWSDVAESHTTSLIVLHIILLHLPILQPLNNEVIIHSRDESLASC